MFQCLYEIHKRRYINFHVRLCVCYKEGLVYVITLLAFEQTKH